MRKAVSILLLCSTLFALSACGTGKVEESAGGGLKDTQEALSEESAQEISENIAKTESYTGSNILIAYFTWADNTNVEDKDTAVQSALSHYDSVGDSADYDGVDATTSASVLPPGNTAQMAEWIWQRVGGDLFSITVTEPYSSDYDECLDRAADEKAENARLQQICLLLSSTHTERTGSLVDPVLSIVWEGVSHIKYFTGQRIPLCAYCNKNLYS